MRIRSLSKTQVLSILQPFIADSVRIIEEAFRVYQDTYPGRHKHGPTTRAAIINAEIVAAAAALWAGHPHVRIVRRRERYLFVFRDQVVVRFKKLRPGGFAVNLRTRQSTGYSRQIPLPGLPPHAVHLNVGYVPDELHLFIDQVLIACPSSIASVAWTHLIGGLEMLSPETQTELNLIQSIVPAEVRTTSPFRPRPELLPGKAASKDEEVDE